MNQNNVLINLNLRHHTKSDEANWRDIKRAGAIITPVIMLIIASGAYLLHLFRAGVEASNFLFDFSLAFFIMFNLGIGIVGVILGVAIKFVNIVYRPAYNIKPGSLIYRRVFGIPPLPVPLRMIWHYPFVLIRDGRLIKNEDRWVFWLGGPAKLVVLDGSAVYLEKSGHYSRVIGPGVTYIGRFETVADIVNLKPAAHSGYVNSWTRDGIKVKIGIRVVFQIGYQSLNGKLQDQLYPFEEYAVRRAVESTTVRYDTQNSENEVTGWEKGVLGQVQGTLARHIANHSIDELFLPTEDGNDFSFSTDVLKGMQKEITSGLRRLGTYLRELQITDIEIPDDVKLQRLRNLQAEGERFATIRRGRAKAYQIRETEKARASAQRDLISALAEGLEGMTPAESPESLLIFLSNVLDQNMDDPFVRPFMARGAISTLEELQKLLKTWS